MADAGAQPVHPGDGGAALVAPLLGAKMEAPAHPQESAPRQGHQRFDRGTYKMQMQFKRKNEKALLQDRFKKSYSMTYVKPVLTRKETAEGEKIPLPSRSGTEQHLVTSFR